MAALGQDTGTVGEPSAELPAGTDAEPRLDVVFGVLRNPRRRLVLEYLSAEPQTTQGELAEHIAAVENDVDRAAITSKQRKRVYVALYQTHLPKLAEAGAIDFDKHRGTVRRRPETDAFLAYLERVQEDEATAPERRTELTVGGTVLGAFGLIVTLDVSGVLGGGAVAGAAVVLVAAVAGAVACSLD